MNPSTPHRDLGPHDTSFTAHDFFTILLRRWWLLLITVSIGAAAGYWSDRKMVNQFTAQALVQRQAKPTTEALGFSAFSTDPLDIASEMQILKSRGVIAEAVDSFGLRAKFSSPHAHRHVIANVSVDARAPRGRYQLAGDGNGFVLSDHAGKVIARAQPAGVLTGPGFRLELKANAAPVNPPVYVTIRDREKAIKSVQTTLIADNDWGATLIRLRFRDTDPNYASNVLNGVATAYVSHDRRRSRDEAIQRASLVERQLAEVRDSLTEARGVLLSYQGQHGSIDDETFSSKLEEAETQQVTLRQQLGVLDGVVASLRSNAPIEDAFRRVLVDGSGFLPSGEALYAQLKSLQTDRQKLTAPRFGYTEADPRVQVLDSLILATRDELLAITEQAARSHRVHLQTVATRIAALRGQLSVIPQQTAVASAMRQRVEAVQRTFDLLADKNYEANIAADAAAGNSEIVDPAVAPIDPDPSRKGTLLLGLAIGLFIGVAIAFLFENMDSSIRRLGDVERATGLRVLALIPRAQAQRGKKHRSVGIITDQRAAESFRLLRTALRFIREDENRILAVTSARPKEGKTTVASNLAVAYSRQSDRVLIIDADLRRPTLHNVLGMPRGTGLSDVLNGDVSLSSAARLTRYRGLYALTCGSGTENPAELLGSVAFADLLKQCRNDFEMVIVDTPPVLPVADAALVASVVDAIVLVARAGATNRHALAHAAGELRKFGVPPIGVVLNAAPVFRSYGRYAAYAGYYHFEAHNDYYATTPVAAGSASATKRSSRSIG